MIDLRTAIAQRARGFRVYLAKATKIFWLVLLVGCAEPPLDRIPSNGTILAFGDSLTVGVGASEADSYPVVLADLTNRRVVSAGVSGEQTNEGRERFQQVLAESAPDLVILLEGGNDILRNVDYAETKTNLDAMLKMAADRNIPVVLIGVPEKNLFAGAAPFYAELAAEYDLVYESDLLGSLLRTPGYKSDPIHLNARGYRAMAEALFELLQDNGAI